ncbi:hypothetical protein EMIT0324P_220001 [Pseudomonas chlororaphis]
MVENVEMQKSLRGRTVNQFWTVSAGDGWQCVGVGGVCGGRRESDALIEQVCSRQPRACVVTATADGMAVEQLADYMRQYWPPLKTRLLAGEYPARCARCRNPQAQKVKPGNWAFPAHACLRPYSYGSRPGRSAHQV